MCLPRILVLRVLLFLYWPHYLAPEFCKNEEEKTLSVSELHSLATNGHHEIF